MNRTHYTPSRRSYYQSSNISKTETTHRRFKKRSIILFILFIAGVFAFNSQITHAGDHKSATPIYSHKQTVCIDPGHGGADPGASSNDGLITERDINLTVALKLRDILNAQGYEVFMTRTSNSVSMDNRVRYTYCNDHHASVMVSVHHNFFDDDTVDYAMDLFYKPVDKGLANSIVSATASKLNITDNGIAQFEDGVLSESTMPAAVSEGFFITSSDEYSLLTDSTSTRLADEASGIASGIVTYLNNPAKANAAAETNIQTLDRSSD
ncbi:MAG: N-acetylmuramoyl-L-alanine amidase [Candidatus Saccharibacteria bacterium]|nr:N-acetylmuramoyl-L-alanine amidase [Candidatus Saccharibacteria bacterium]